ncbi:MAG TPA: c-type cytochrome [Dehalococcoidia bacterium]|jgi:mono/diheme cytochrome c family protein|nr:c-type cytochrome [Dehalococcoidia bacterium]
MMNRAERNPVLSRTRTGQVKRGLRRWFFGVAMLFGIVLVGCSQGSYPVDIFYEQHYQQSYRSHEPPRLIGVADAVAFYPPTASTVTNTGADLFRVNCQMCHGSDAKGTGPVLARIINSYGYQPIVDTNITTRPVSFIASRLEAESRPLGPSSVMPPFGKLLSENERNAIAEYVGSLPK